MAEKKKILYIVEAMGGGVFTYILIQKKLFWRGNMFCVNHLLL